MSAGLDLLDLPQGSSKNTMTSESYTRMVEEIEAQIAAVKSGDKDNKQRLIELKKKKRALKNKASAMRCREKKRRRMEDLERTVQELHNKLIRLEQENKSLRVAAGVKKAAASVQQQALPKRETINPLLIDDTPGMLESGAASSQIISEPATYLPTTRVKLENKAAKKVSQSRTHAVTSGTLSAADLDFSDWFTNDDAGEGDAFVDDSFLFDETVQTGQAGFKTEMLSAVDDFFDRATYNSTSTGGGSLRKLVGAL